MEGTNCLGLQVVNLGGFLGFGLSIGTNINQNRW